MGFQEPTAPPGSIVDSIDHDELATVVDAVTRERIVALARDFPVPAQTVCYEVRLSDDAPEVDCAFCLFPRWDDVFANGIEALRVRHHNEPEWSRCAAFLKAWTASDSDLAPLVPFIALAFDLAPGAVSSAPCVSVCIDKDFFIRRLGFAPDEPASAEDYEALIADCHEALLGEELTVASRNRLRRCLCSGYAEPMHVSFMLSRSPQAFKLDIRVRLEDLERFLREIGWPASLSPLCARVRRLIPSLDAVQLNLVMSPEQRDPLLEVELLTRAGDIDQQYRVEFLARLVEAGLCSPEKARTLRSISQSPLQRLENGLPVARNWYVKVRFRGFVPVDAKAYLAHMPRPGIAARPASEVVPWSGDLFGDSR